MDHKRLCGKLLKLDSEIEFACIVNSKGELTAQKNSDAAALLSIDEMNMISHYAFEMWDRLQNLEYKFGKKRTFITSYENVTMIGLIMDGNLLLVGAEPGCAYSDIIQKIRIVTNKNTLPKKKKTTSKPQKRPVTKKETSSKRSYKTQKTKKKSVSRKSSKKHDVSDIEYKLKKIEERIEKLSLLFNNS